MSRLHKSFLYCCAVVITSLVGGVSSASAATIEIQFFGLDLQYNDDGVTSDSGIFDIYDAADHAGGILDSDDADSLSSVGFFKDDVLQGSVFTDEIFIDLLVEDINIPLGLGSAVSGGNGDSFGLDLWSDAVGSEWHLQLDIDTVTVFHTGSGIFVSLGGTASSLSSQDLPFGLEIDDTFAINFVISSASVNILASGGGQITDLTASGVGNIEGTLVPEPSTMILALLGGLGLLFSAVRRKRQTK